jgi:signal transduction histidine kinase
MNVRTWLGAAGRRRTMAEVGLLAFLLTLPLAAILRPALRLGLAYADVPEVEARWPVLGLSMLYVGLFAALLGALRLRPAETGWRERIRYELAGLVAIVFAVWAGALVAHAVGMVWVASNDPPGARYWLLSAAWSPLLAVVSATSSLVWYTVLRGGRLAWPLWDRLRRTRLLWALTHAQLIAALGLVVSLAAVFHASGVAREFGPPFGPEVLPPDASSTAIWVARITTRLLPTATALMVLGLVASLAVLPPAALISYLVLRRTTGRLEGLAAAAESLQAGDLAVRVPVDGEDEVSQLQASFNVMASSLGRTLSDLQAERDRVTGLLEARRQLVAGVSHELRTPVATIRGYLESALRRGETVPPDLRTDLETMEREVTRLQGMIEDLFTLSRATVGRLELRPEPTDAGAVVRRLVDTMAPLAWGQRRVQVLADVAPDLPPAHADAQRLEQIVSNLLGNAVRHTPPGGMVAAAVATEPDTVRVEVRDTGEGISPNDLPHVFERFYRGQNGGGNGGAGLGLALAKEMTEAMGGSVEAASAPGEGSCFTVRLPRA